MFSSPSSSAVAIFHSPPPSQAHYYHSNDNSPVPPPVPQPTPLPASRPQLNHFSPPQQQAANMDPSTTTTATAPIDRPPISNFPSSGLIAATPNTALIQENISLKATILDLNSQILALKTEQKSNKALLKNLKAINVSVQEENTIRTKDNNALKAKVLETEKKVDNLNSQLLLVNNNLNRSRKVYTTLQLRTQENEKSLKEQIEAKDKEIEELQKTFQDKETEMNKEKNHLLHIQHKLENEGKDLSKQLSEAKERISILEGEKMELQDQVEHLIEKCEGISDFVNHEMETVSQWN